jgi:hypothetical protein
LIGKPEIKKALGTLIRKWEDDIKMDLRKTGSVFGMDSPNSRLGPALVCCEHGNKTLVSIKCWKFLEWLSKCWLPKKDSAPWS